VFYFANILKINNKRKQTVVKTLKNILLYIWQLPQNLLGLILIWYYKMIDGDRCYKYDDYNGIEYWVSPSMPSGISLGKYVIFKYEYREESNSFKHEYGHTIQSKKLGWLYLIVIGLPSLCGNIYDRLFHSKWDYVKSSKWYYNQPWEKWADKEGKVYRIYK